jgi:hypothetical protein
MRCLIARCIARWCRLARFILKDALAAIMYASVTPQTTENTSVLNWSAENPDRKPWENGFNS